MDTFLKGKLNAIETAQNIHGLFNIQTINIPADSHPKNFEPAKTTKPFLSIHNTIDEEELFIAIEMAI